MVADIRVDASKCTGCALCIQVCFLGNFTKSSSGNVEAAQGEVACIKCGHCIAACPNQAITHPDIDSSLCEPIEDNANISYDHLLAFLKKRHSRREFKKDSVPADVIDKLLQAAVEAPSALNRQSIQYTVITDLVVINQISSKTADFFSKVARSLHNPIGRLFFRMMGKNLYNDLIALLPEIDYIVGKCKSGHDNVLYNAPCAIILHAPKSDTFAAENAVYNTANILLAAEALGLGACVIGFVTAACKRDSSIKQTAHIPLDHTVCSTIALGYPIFNYTNSAPKRMAVWD